MRYDVIVVGAGPAGSTVARECAGRGLSVLLLDKAEFPRDKPCGGGVTVRAAGLLPFSIAPVVEREVMGLHMTLRQSHGFTRQWPHMIASMTQRCRLDAFLVERALDAGVTLRQRAHVREVERYSSHIVVRSRDESFEGRTLVAADGVNGQTARLAGVRLKLIQGIALEGNITPPGGVPARWKSVIGLDMGAPPGGYGWIFPKGDHVNIGLGGWLYIGPSMREQLDHLVRFYGFDPADMWGVRGYHLPIRERGSPLADGNLLLVGDAAGLLDPLTGEGIHSAIWSGRTAAEHLASYIGGEARDLSGYQQQVERELAPHLSVSRQFHDLFSLTPRLYVGIERWTSLLLGLAARVLRGEQTYAGFMRDHSNIATIVDFVSDLIRVSPFLQRRAGLQHPAPPQRFFLNNQRMNPPISQISQVKN